MKEGEELNLKQEINTMTEESNTEKTTNNSMAEQVSDNDNPTTEAASDGELVSLTREQLQNRYRNGFRVAVNYLYHRHDPADQPAFKAFLESKMPAAHVEDAIMLKSTMEPLGSCPPGKCPDGNGGCSDCTFDLAFDEGYFSEPV